MTLQVNENEHLNMATAPQDEIELAKQMISFKQTMENNKRGCTDESGMDNVKDMTSHYPNGAIPGSSSSSSSQSASQLQPSVKRQKTTSRSKSSSTTTSSLSSDSQNCGGDLNIIATAAASKSQLEVEVPSTKTKGGKVKTFDRGVGTKTFSDNDVLSGRGGGTNLHPGNRFYRELIFTMRKEYDNASKSKKPLVSKKIVSMVRQNGGRFLSKNPKDGLYYDIGDEAAREKTSQALRHRTFEMRRECNGSSIPAPESSVPILPEAAATSDNITNILQDIDHRPIGLTQSPWLDMRNESHYIQDRTLSHKLIGIREDDAAGLSTMHLAAANASPFGILGPSLESGTALDFLQQEASEVDFPRHPAANPVDVGAATKPFAGSSVGMKPSRVTEIAATGQQAHETISTDDMRTAEEAVDVLATVATMLAKPAPLNDGSQSDDGSVPLASSSDRYIGPHVQANITRPIDLLGQPDGGLLSTTPPIGLPPNEVMMDLEERARAAAETSYYLRHQNLMMGMPAETPELRQLRWESQAAMVARQQLLEDLDLRRTIQLRSLYRQERTPLMGLPEHQWAMGDAYSLLPPGAHLGLGSMGISGGPLQRLEGRYHNLPLYGEGEDRNMSNARLS